jgi:hypothetical protein
MVWLIDDSPANLLRTLPDTHQCTVMVRVAPISPVSESAMFVVRRSGSGLPDHQCSGSDAGRSLTTTACRSVGISVKTLSLCNELRNIRQLA